MSSSAHNLNASSTIDVAATKRAIFRADGSCAAPAIVQYQRGGVLLGDCDARWEHDAACGVRLGRDGRHALSAHCSDDLCRAEGGEKFVALGACIQSETEKTCVCAAKPLV